MSGASWWERFRAWWQPAERFESMDDTDTLALLRRDPAAARRALAMRQRELSQALDRITKAYDARLEDLSSRVSHADMGGGWPHEARAILAKQRDITRLLHRLELAEQELQTLKTEWQDWQRYLGEVGELKDSQQAERMELLRAELTLRGVRLPEATVYAQRASAPARDAIQDEVPFTQAALEQTSGEDLAEWDEWMGRDDEAMDRFRELYQAPDADPRELADACHRLRELQAEQRLLDRRRGTRRDRLAVFERM